MPQSAIVTKTLGKLRGTPWATISTRLKSRALRITVIKFGLVILMFLSLTACAKKNLLIGKWRDENSVVEYRVDGTATDIRDDGGRLTGYWAREKDIIRFIPPAWTRRRPSEHRIISLTSTELVTEGVRTKRIFHAKKIK